MTHVVHMFWSRMTRIPQAKLHPEVSNNASTQGMPPPMALCFTVRTRLRWPTTANSPCSGTSPAVFVTRPGVPAWHPAEFTGLHRKFANSWDVSFLFINIGKSTINWPFSMAMLNNQRVTPWISNDMMPKLTWLVVDLPLWRTWVRQLGWLFPIYGKNKKQCSKPPTSVNKTDSLSWWWLGRAGWRENPQENLIPSWAVAPPIHSACNRAVGCCYSPQAWPPPRKPWAWTFGFCWCSHGIWMNNNKHNNDSSHNNLMISNDNDASRPKFSPHGHCLPVHHFVVRWACCDWKIRRWSQHCKRPNHL